MIRFEDIEEKVRQNYPNADLALLKKAYVFSAKEHANQFRKSGEPYMDHPLEVANILADMGLDLVAVTVGLLHDIVEDTLTDLAAVEKMFGPEVATLVDGVTKISQIPFTSTEHKQAENFRKLLLAMSNDVKVILVKLADRLHNMRTLQYLEPDKRVRIARETMDIYAPIANRLGMGKIKGQLEDLSFLYLEPEKYRETIAMIEKRRAAGERFIREVENRLYDLSAKHLIGIEIQSRIKRVYSVHSKMRRMKVPFEKIYDFVAVRCIAESLPDCYTLLGIVHNTWKLIPGRFKDYISMPRPNGYQSVHTTLISDKGIPFEIQIRTREMHRRAEEGIAAHWKYKEARFSQDDSDQRFTWLRHLLEWQKEVEDPHEFISNLKVDLYPQEVYIFTPRGDVITLPIGATPVDFAFAIHSEVGRHCSQALVNNEPVPLDYPLGNGEIVEIITARDRHPSRDWLGFVRTAKARSQIRQWLKSQETMEYKELGRQMLEKEGQRHRLALKAITGHPQMPEKLAGHDLADIDALYAAIGLGRIIPRQFLETLFHGELEEETEKDVVEIITDKVKNVFRRGGPSFQVSEIDSVIVERARCCEPIRGEEIIGHFTPGHGLIVHARNCAALEKSFTHAERLVDVSWGKPAKDEVFTVTLQLNCADRKGMIADVSKKISELNVNIRRFDARADERHHGIFQVTMDVQDIKQLEKVVRILKSLKDVEDIARVVDNRILQTS